MLNLAKDRPLLFFVISFVFGMIVSSVCGLVTKIILVSLLTFLALIIISFKRPLYGNIRRLAAVFPLIIGILFGTSYHYLAIERQKDKISSLEGKEKEITAVVEEISYRSEYFVSYKVRVVGMNDEETGFDCAVSVPYDIGAEENDVIRLRVKFSLPEKDNYGFQLREYYSSRGIYILAEASDENARIIGIDRSIQSFFRSLSSRISVKFKTALGRYHGGYVSGLLLGRKSDVPDSITTSYRYLGISHILSVSGLHLSILAGSLMIFLSALTLRRSNRYILTVAFIISFILLTGSRPSVIRSGIMLILLLVAQLTGKKYDPITALSFAAFVIIMISPTAIYDAGFILSVSATTGIILLGAPITKWLYHISNGKGLFISTLSRLLNLFAITASATVFTLPALWYYFGEVSSVSLISNIIFIPLNTVLMYLAVLFLIFCQTPLSPSFAGMTASLASLITGLSDRLMRILPSPIDLTYPFAVLSVFIAASTLIFFMIKKKRTLALVLSLTAFTLSYYSCLTYYNHLHKGEENVILSSVDGNDYVIINAEGKTLLCDFSTGSYSSSRHAFELVQPKLHDSSVDTVLLTHLHRKHIDMIRRLSDNYKITQLFIPSPQSDEETIFSRAIQETAEERGVKVITYNSDRDVTFDFAGIKITLYQRTYIERSVQPVNLMRIEGKRNFLYVGSSVFEGDLADKARAALAYTDVLFLGGHGPLIKEALPTLPFNGEVIVSNTKTNEAYGTSYKTVDFYKKYITK